MSIGFMPNNPYTPYYGIAMIKNAVKITLPEKTDEYVDLIKLMTGSQEEDVK